MAITINGNGTITGISAGGLPDDSVTTDDIADNAITMAKLATSGTLPALDGSALTGVGGAAEVSRNYKAQASVSSSTLTKILFDGTPTFDTDSAWDSSNGRFVPTIAGYYSIGGFFDPPTSSRNAYFYIYKNGSSYSGPSVSYSNNSADATKKVYGQDLIYLDGSTDYVEIYAYYQNLYTTPATVYMTVNTFLVKAD